MAVKLCNYLVQIETGGFDLRSEMVAVVYCYMILTVYTVRRASPAIVYNGKRNVSFVLV